MLPFGSTGQRACKHPVDGLLCEGFSGVVGCASAITSDLGTQSSGPRFRSRSRARESCRAAAPTGGCWSGDVFTTGRRTGRERFDLTRAGRRRRRGRPRSTTSGTPYSDSLPDVSRCGVGDLQLQDLIPRGTQT